VNVSSGLRPGLVGSMTSGVDGASEGGRLSTSSLPTTLALYSAALGRELSSRNGGGGWAVEPAEVDGTWVIKVTCEGDEPRAVPETWQGHRVVLEPASASPPAEEGR
jgi:hypothetical protein